MRAVGAVRGSFLLFKGLPEAFAGQSFAVAPCHYKDKSPSAGRGLAAKDVPNRPIRSEHLSFSFFRGARCA